MNFNPDIHHRHTIRLKNYDYSQNGAYFVTLCSWQRESLFGEIVGGEMLLNDFGVIVRNSWGWLAEQYAHVALDEWAVMPNHFHGIILITNGDGGLRTVNSQMDNSQTGVSRTAPTGKAKSLGSLIGAFKTVCTKQINIIRNNPGCPVWQRNYYERVIRDETELAAAREYIVNNPLKWELDRENPVNFTVGAVREPPSLRNSPLKPGGSRTAPTKKP